MMHRFLWIILLAAWTVSVHSQEVKHKFIGASACGMCHKGEKKGKQLEIWQNSKHATAFADLASDKAKEIGKQKGIENPQADGRCLKCHTAGHGENKDLFLEKFKAEDGVQCESCHGAGADYKANAVMKVRDDAVKNGLTIVNVSDGSAEKLCKTCHNEESPTFQSFDFIVEWEKVTHPKPK